ncbi:putative Methyltransferase domain containing protein [Leishmania utingensis]|uniref:Methyltransferase domain containing protein n=1 Tax=Leishmania utingensis TaxID=653362 RepID=A0AAW3B4W6_9TRYP
MQQLSAVVSNELSELTKSWTPEQQKLYGVVSLTAVVAAGTPMIGVSVMRQCCCGHCRRDVGGSDVAFSESHSKSSDIYESEALARQYMEFHYTPSHESYTQRLQSVSEAYDFPTRVAQKFRTYIQTGKRNLRGLDIGCATGASVLEMSKVFDGGVIGIDFSEVFIHLAKEVVNQATSGKRVAYTAPVQGEITEPRELQLPHEARPDRCEFYAGDAMNMFEEDHKITTKASRLYPNVKYWQARKGETFDGVLCLNLIDRVPDPQRLLDSFARLLAEDGILILADPYSWWEDATEKSRWLGGRKENGIRSEEAVKAALASKLELLSESDEAFLIRDHIRHYQLGFSHCTVWRKK